MRANYHTHTVRCRHAKGREEEYVQRALEGGLEILGFSDHTPYWFPGNGYYSTFRMFPEQLEEYVQTVLSLKEKYAGKIQILLGLEVEYYPDLFPTLLEQIRKYPVEYMLLGQHFVGNEINDSYSGQITEDVSILTRYCDQTIKAMETGLFTYLAHPDLIHFTGDAAVYQQQMRRICQKAKACDIPVEMNFLGLREGRHYPNPLFWDVAAEEGCRVIFGGDAHAPEYVWDPDTEKKARRWMAKLGLKVLETVLLRPIR